MSGSFYSASLMGVDMTSLSTDHSLIGLQNMRDKGQICQGSARYKVDIHAVIFQSLLYQVAGVIGMFIQSIGIILMIVNGF